MNKKTQVLTALLEYFHQKICFVFPSLLERDFFPPQTKEDETIRIKTREVGTTDASVSDVCVISE